MSPGRSQFQTELDAAKRLAREAGAIALDFRSGNLAVQMKAGDEPVTAADHAASDHIVSGLAAAFSNDIIISEESPDDLRRLDAERVWYIDPIDGTRDFIRGGDGFCVMIGLATKHEPVVGVLFQPTTARTMWSAPDIGTWVESPDGETLRGKVSSVRDMQSARLVASKTQRDDSVDTIKRALGIRDESNVGSIGLKIAHIAFGVRDLYVNPAGKCKAWDTCAPQTLLVHAGGRLGDITGQPLRYDQRDLQHRSGMIASNGHLHAASVAKLSPLFGH